MTLPESMDEESVAELLRSIYSECGMLAGVAGHPARLQQARAVLALVESKVRETAIHLYGAVLYNTDFQGEPYGVWPPVDETVARVMGRVREGG